MISNKQKSKVKLITPVFLLMGGLMAGTSSFAMPDEGKNDTTYHSTKLAHQVPKSESENRKQIPQVKFCYKQVQVPDIESLAELYSKGSLVFPEKGNEERRSLFLNTRKELFQQIVIASAKASAAIKEAQELALAYDKL